MVVVLQNPYFLPTFGNVQNPLRLPRKTTSECQKVLRTREFFTVLTSKCASRQNSVRLLNIWTSTSALNVVCFVHFDFKMCFAPQRRTLFRHLNFQKWSGRGVHCTFWLRNGLRATTACTFSNISTSKSGMRMVCFVHFDFEMCFAPQQRALFRHLNFQKCSEAEVLCAFWLRNVLRAAMACNFSSLIWPDCSAPAVLASLLFDPPEPQIIAKTQCYATFLPFRAPGSSFFWLFLFSDLLSSSLLFSDSSHLCFSICPYCRKFDF